MFLKFNVKSAVLRVHLYSLLTSVSFPILQEVFEDIKGVIRIRKSKNRQHNDQNKKYKKTNNDLQNKHIKLKIE